MIGNFRKGHVLCFTAVRRVRSVEIRTVATAAITKDAKCRSHWAIKHPKVRTWTPLFLC
ncbi:hypothetical protein BDDG_01505 [Blastomyces dermatitidis ATCC 18188]|uniref:Uncharacterized protein n=1 Tax=Ajellomyces dermatitidis (strain ATCC 18188 / CBS 674.68) TaxID=653446 RepID=F2T5Q5_AJEDA|nr:hypothetical protein BDDG_01505 [Blastomyces dermatitidis ATCC 18188]